MKKGLRFIVLLVLILVLIVCLYLIRILYTEKEKNNCDFLLDDILLQVNLSTNNNFKTLDNDNITEFIPLSIKQNANYLFSSGIQSPEEYFMVIKNIEDDVLFDLKKYVETNNKLDVDKKILLKSNGEYTYIIYSVNYDSIIEGIIRSYIYCK